MNFRSLFIVLMLVGFPVISSASTSCEKALLASTLTNIDPEYYLEERIQVVLQALGKSDNVIPKYFAGQKQWLESAGVEVIPNFSADRFSKILGDYRSTQILKWAFLGYARELAGLEANFTSGVESLIFSDAGLSGETLQAFQRGSRDSRKEFLNQTIRILMPGKTLSGLKLQLEDFSQAHLRRSANLVSQLADYFEFAPDLDGESDLKLHEKMTFEERQTALRETLIKNLNSIEIEYGEPITSEMLDRIQNHWGDYIFWIRLGIVALRSNGNTDRILNSMKVIAQLKNPKLLDLDESTKKWLRPRSRIQLISDQSVITTLNVINPRVLANAGTLTGGSSCISLSHCDHPQAIAGLLEPEEQMLVSYALSPKNFANPKDFAEVVSALKSGADIPVTMSDDLRLELQIGKNRVITLPITLAHRRLMLVLEEGGIYPANESSQTHPAQNQMYDLTEELMKQIVHEMGLPILEYRKRYR